MGTATGSGSVVRYALLVAVPAAVAGAAVAWLLGRTAVPAGSVRALADCLGALTLGIAAVSRLQRGLNRPAVPAARMWRAIAVVALAWTAAEAYVFLLEAADTSNVAVSALDSRDLTEFVSHVSAGRVGVVTVVCTLAVAVLAVLAYRAVMAPTLDLPLALSAFALVLRPITGHMSQQPLGALLAAAHTLAAGLWFGTLAAMALQLRSRSDWAQLLPRYSLWAIRCVLVVGVTGLVNAWVRLRSVDAFLDTGYGRVASAKVIGLAVLLLLGGWWRRNWVPRAAEHRLSESDSLARAVIEVVAMAIVFGLAAALAITA
ncbi:copper resistance protein CopD [Skermania sp. ID1734]|uniref:CopD family protein n=1 Tax=Skermania sp. ID1734 TaxID=2597516 RepID=UPI00117EF258|nr:CopD family protein [Skermania sp. ID1734]TSD93456.1 copper resistance protein CopD [Skermania sp. ID1734]